MQISDIENNAEYVKKCAARMGLSNRTIDASAVPAALRHLIPLAEAWGETDDGRREELTRLVGWSFSSFLKSVLAKFEDEMDLWLTGPEATRRPLTEAYVSFSAMRLAADLAQRRWFIS